MTCVHGWRPPVCLGLRPPSRGHVAARWRRARRRPAALPPPPPCCTSPASRHPIPRADWSARRAPCDRPLGSAPAGPRAAEGGELGALPPPFSRLWSRAVWCLPVGASTSFFRLFLTAYLKSRGQAPCSTRGHLCRLLLASGGGHRKVRRPVSLPVTVWSRFRGKSCRSALAGAARCALFSAWSCFGLVAVRDSRGCPLPPPPPTGATALCRTHSPCAAFWWRLGPDAAAAWHSRAIALHRLSSAREEWVGRRARRAGAAPPFCQRGGVRGGGPHPSPTQPGAVENDSDVRLPLHARQPVADA